MTSKSQDDLEKELKNFRHQYKKLQEIIDKAHAESDWYTSNEIVFSQGAVQLRRFSGSDKTAPPVMIVYSHVNRPVVIDLTRKRSLIQQLIKCGHQVYLIDWREVDQNDANTALSAYFHDYIDAACNFILESTAFSKINLLGICQGGTFSLCYASVNPEKLNRLVTLVTPVDFHAGDGVLAKWTRHLDLSSLESNPINIPGTAITVLFQAIRPFEDLIRQVELIKQPDSEKNIELVTRMDQWIYDCPDQPGKAFAQFVRFFYQENCLVNASLNFNGQELDLNKIRLPVLNVFARYDHLVPPESSSALAKFIDQKYYRELQFPGGHIGLLVSEKAHRTIAPEIGKWLIENDNPD